MISLASSDKGDKQPIWRPELMPHNLGGGTAWLLLSLNHQMYNLYNINLHSTARKTKSG